MISLCVVENFFPKDILYHCYSVPHLVILFANWVITTLRAIIFAELNFKECLSAVLSYRKNIEEKKFDPAQKIGKNCLFSRELTFANWMFQNFSRGPIFAILAKNSEIAKVSFAKISSFEVNIFKALNFHHSHKKRKVFPFFMTMFQLIIFLFTISKNLQLP